MRRLWVRTTAGVIINVLNRRRPDNDLPRRSVGGIGIRWNLRHRVAEFSHGIQGLVRWRFRGPVPAHNLLRDGRARLRSGRGLCDVALLGGRSLCWRRAHRRRDLALLHGPVSRRLLGCRFLRRQLLGRHVLDCRRLGRGVITRRVLRRGLLRGDLSGYGILACETLRHRHPGYEQLGLGVPLRRRLGRGWQGCGLVGNGRRLPAVRRRLFSCLAVGFGRDLDRARVRPRACRHPGEAAPRQAVPIKKPPALLRAGGVSRRIGRFCCDQRSVDGKKQDRYANGDHAPERNQGCRDHKTQMRVQGPSP
jgi:hypothetical protein